MSFTAIAAIWMVLFAGRPSQVLPPQNICGDVQDQTRAFVVDATLELATAHTLLYAKTDAGGQFCFNHLEPNEYELTVQASGFQTNRQKVTVHAGESVHLTISLKLETVAAASHRGGRGRRHRLAERRPDRGGYRAAFENLPSESVNAALSSILTLATPGVAADSNGVFHPLGEHAETSFSVDGQPISDQQSRIFSNQISASTIQEMRTIQGAPPAEFGDKTSLIVEATTRSGLNAGKSSGTVSLGYGSFATPTASITLASGSRPSGISWRWTESTATVFWTRRNFSLFMRAATPKIYLIALTGGPATRPRCT